MSIDISRFTVADKYGNDPLRDKLYVNLDKITRHINHTVKSGEEGNPQLIAFDYFGSVELYKVILAFNGIVDSFEIEAGMEIKIPEPSQVLALAKNEQKNKTVSI